MIANGPIKSLPHLARRGSSISGVTAGTTQTDTDEASQSARCFQPLPFVVGQLWGDMGLSRPSVSEKQHHLADIISGMLFWMSRLVAIGLSWLQYPIVQRLDPVCCSSGGEPNDEVLGCEPSFWRK